MNTLEKSIYQEINDKLNESPREILKTEITEFQLSKKQKLELHEMESKTRTELNFSSSKNIHSRLKEKYGL